MKLAFEKKLIAEAVSFVPSGYWTEIAKLLGIKRTSLHYRRKTIRERFHPSGSWDVFTERIHLSNYQNMVRQFDQAIVRRFYQQNEENQTRTAEALGLKLSTLQYKLDRLKETDQEKENVLVNA